MFICRHLQKNIKNQMTAIFPVRSQKRKKNPIPYLIFNVNENKSHHFTTYRPFLYNELNVDVTSVYRIKSNGSVWQCRYISSPHRVAICLVNFPTDQRSFSYSFSHVKVEPWRWPVCLLELLEITSFHHSSSSIL